MNLPQHVLDAIAEAEKEGRVVEHGVTRTAPAPCPEPGVAEAGAGRPMPEKEFDARVVAYAESRGWISYHTYDSRRSSPGFPDRVFVRDRVVFAELKREDGRLSKDQAVWLAALMHAGAEAYAWRPSDWDEIAEVLK